MTQTPEPPRYIVQLPEGDCELDAKEICRRYRLRQINFSTMVRPVKEMRVTRLDEDAAFAPALTKLYRKQEVQFILWPPVIYAGITVAAILLIITTMPLVTMNLMMIVVGFFSPKYYPGSFISAVRPDRRITVIACFRKWRSRITTALPDIDCFGNLPKICRSNRRDGGASSMRQVGSCSGCFMPAACCCPTVGRGQ